MLIAQTEAEELPTVTVNPYFTFDPVTKAVSETKQHMNEFGNDELVKVAKTGENESLIVIIMWLCYAIHCYSLTMPTHICVYSEQNDLLSTGGW